MRAVARCRVGEGPAVVLGHGDLIGRLATAAVSLDDARISEAHAIVSLRGGAMRLLALRGRFRVHGKQRAEVVLAPGLDVELARGIVLHVDEVSLPDTVLAIAGPGLPPWPLPGTVSVATGPPRNVSTV